MSNILVSIIVPFYNVEKYIEKCLKSIAQQTYRNIEVLMINDGSKDGSRSIAYRYAKEDERFFLLDKDNGGLSSGRNYGIERCKGQFICFVDSDDFLLPGYVEDLLMAFDNNIDVVIGNYNLYNDKTKKEYNHSFQFTEKLVVSKEDKEDLIKDMIIRAEPVMSVWKNMYRASFINENHLLFESEREIYAEDEVFNIYAYTEARAIHLIDKIVYTHTFVDNSLSQGYRDRFLEMNIALRKRLHERLMDCGLVELANEFDSSKGSLVGPCLLNACKTKYRNAVENVRELYRNQDYIQLLSGAEKKIAPYRYRVLFRIAKTKQPILIVNCIKMLTMGSGLYRVIIHRS